MSDNFDKRGTDPLLKRMNIRELVILVTLSLNLLATVAGYIDMRITLEHRLTYLETSLNIHMMQKDSTHKSFILPLKKEVIL